MKIYILAIAFISLSFATCLGQMPKAEYGPVFDNIGPTFEVDNVDILLDSTTILKTIFDIDYESKDSLSSNRLISSLHRYLNMHVKSGVKEENISLAFVLHGASTQDALSDDAYMQRFGVKNPNTNLIKTLAAHGVDMYICGQSASFRGFAKSELSPDIKLSLSAMTVLTIYQSKGYSMIKF